MYYESHEVEQYWDCDDCGERYPLLRRHGHPDFWYPPRELETITDGKHVCGPGHDEVLLLCQPCYNKRQTAASAR